ncbi:MAG: ABC transporter ATP-binding protein/permease, partial [Kiritimatiellae bacterium]|nr:ABC transporter ATP-binding protein/permease [Kiritimatiellia bacterium]
MKTDWARFNKYLYNYWRLQAAVIFLGLVTVPLSLLNPYLAKLIIDKAYGNKDLKLFLILAVIGGSIFVINGLLTSLSDYLSQRVKCGVNFNMTKDTFRHLQSLPVSFFKDKSAGEHIYKISNDVGSLSHFVADTVPAMATLFPRFLFILIIVFYLNWELALLATLLVPISCVSPYLFTKWIREMTRRMAEKFEGIFERLLEVFVNIHLVKALGKEDYEIRRFEESLTEKIDCELKNAKLLSVSSFSGSVLNKVIGGVIALYGGYQVIQGTMTLGSLTAIMIYLTQLLGLTNSIGRFYETVLISSVSRERLGEILDITPGRRDAQGAVDHRIMRGRIEFRDISFGYNRNEFIMKGMSFSIEPSAKIALTGPSGCGKTTLLALILGLYEPGEGSILLDELDIRDIKLKCLKAQIGIALQEPFLWNDTVANNILYGAEQAGKEDMIKAAKIAEAHNFILNLPEQYDST